MVPVSALLDSGASRNFMSMALAGHVKGERRNCDKITVRTAGNEVYCTETITLSFCFTNVINYCISETFLLLPDITPQIILGIESIRQHDLTRQCRYLFEPKEGQNESSEEPQGSSVRRDPQGSRVVGKETSNPHHLVPDRSELALWLQVGSDPAFQGRRLHISDLLGDPDKPEEEELRGIESPYDDLLCDGGTPKKEPVFEGTPAEVEALRAVYNRYRQCFAPDVRPEAAKLAPFVVNCKVAELQQTR